MLVKRCCNEHQLTFVLSAYVMSIVVLLPYVNSKDRLCCSQWHHDSSMNLLCWTSIKEIAAGGIQGANGACMMLQHM